LTVLVATAAVVAAFAAPAQAVSVVRENGGTAVGPVYVPVPNGNGTKTDIAVSIWYPPGAYGDTARNWPALFEMDGYQGFPSPNDDEFFGHSTKFIDVYAQIRGTGCSGGQFDLFSRQSAEDGKYIIDNWIPQQPWSNGRVGITGHSYSGLTGFLVAGTAPKVQAVAVSGLIDDFYRSILYPGGILNTGFPILWGALLRPLSEFSGNLQNYENDSECRLNQLQHLGTDTVPLSLLLPVYTQMTATKDSWAISHSLFNVEPNLNAPIQINQQYQDEQTGPRGGYILWQHVPSGLPKRLVLSNGQHNPNDAAGDKGAWLECWLIDKPDGKPCPTITGEGSGGASVTAPVDDGAHRVVEYFDSLNTASGGQQRGTPYLTSDWPDPQTNWQLYYLHGDHTLTTSLVPGDKPVSYISTTTDEHTTGTFGYDLPLPPRGTNIGGLTFIHGPNEARYTLSFGQATTGVSGPILLNLQLRSTAPDTDLFVDLLDYNTKTGEMAYLQRGLMRASFRAVDSAKSDRIQSGPLAGTIYRPYHDYLNTDLMIPGRTYQVPVEIFPLGHVFYPGHELVMDIHAPPFSDPLSTYMYEPHSLPAVNTILPGSTLLMPLMSTLPPLWPTEPSCSQISGYVCFTPPGTP
jgi:predicted acyl esterase